MESRKWEDMMPDCLTKIFGSVGLESLISHIPLVCKSWYNASVNPLCWKKLDFRSIPGTQFDLQSKSPSTFTRLVRFAVIRSCTCATSVILPRCTREVVSSISILGPNLKSLCITCELPHAVCQFLAIKIRKWKHLEVLILDNTCNLLKYGLLTEILHEIILNGESFIGLRIGHTLMTEKPGIREESMAMMSLLPMIMDLKLSCPTSIKIRVSATSYVEYDPDVNEIMKFSSPIKTFKLNEFELMYVDNLLLPASEVSLYRQIVQRYGALRTPTTLWDTTVVELFLDFISNVISLPVGYIVGANWKAKITMLAQIEEYGLNIMWFRNAFNAAVENFSRMCEEVVELLAEMDASKTVEEIEDEVCKIRDIVHHKHINLELNLRDYSVFRFLRNYRGVQQQYLERYNILAARMRTPIISIAKLLPPSIL